MSFLWGADLSGSLRGAGGVGGLVAVVVHSGVQPGSYFSNYDHNGNVVALIDSQSGYESARYEYGPFGELLRSNGPSAQENSIRFSSKYYDEETGLSYYGYRYYSSSLGRWLSKDPIEEDGGLNLFGFVLNDPLANSDYLGLAWYEKIAKLSLATSEFVLNNGKRVKIRNIRFRGKSVTLDMLRNETAVADATIVRLEQKYGKDLKIKYDKAAQPDFSGHLKAPEVNINVSGDSVKDAASAWAQLEARGVDVSRLKTEDLNFHHAGGGRMQLIDADLNRAFAHTGEAALVRANKYAIIAGILAPSTTELIASSQRNGTVPSCGRTFFVAVVDQLRWMDPGFESLYHATKENTYSKVKDELQFRKKHPTAFYYRIEPKL